MEKLPTQTILDLLTESSELGATNFHVFGGEPFLRDDLGEIFSYAFDLNYTLSIATNGIRITQGDFNWMQRCNPFLGISLHGPQAFHDSFCGMDGAYQKSLDSIKLALQEGVNVVGIPKTIDKDLPETDYCLGFETALNVITEEIDRLRTTTGSHKRIFVVETMGRTAGWLALEGGESPVPSSSSYPSATSL
jgi:6-phosphofructokinase